MGTPLVQKTLSAALSLFIAFGLLSAHIPSAYACSCMVPGLPQESLVESAAVFVGSVTKIASKDDDLHRLVSFNVERSWKGVDTTSVSISTARDSAACGIDFQVGKAYVVYAYERDGEGLWAGLCSRTHEISGVIDADEDVMALGTSTLTLSDAAPHESALGSTALTLVVGLLAVVAGIAAARYVRSKGN